MKSILASNLKVGMHLVDDPECELFYADREVASVSYRNTPSCQVQYELESGFVSGWIESDWIMEIESGTPTMKPLSDWGNVLKELAKVAGCEVSEIGIAISGSHIAIHLPLDVNLG
jgi:hypothetical protein